MAGARWVRKEILDRYPSAELRVFVVWFDMLPTDSRHFVDLRALGDARVTNLWDGKRLVGRWFARNAAGQERGDLGPDGIAWDVYFLYGPDARWEGLGPPAPLVATGSSVIGESGKLAEQMTALLEPAAQAAP